MLVNGACKSILKMLALRGTSSQLDRFQLIELLFSTSNVRKTEQPKW
jgi:hypothetical protein